MSLRRLVLAFAAGLAAVYGIAYADLVLRARSAYYEGEKYLEWERNPSLKKAYFDGLLKEKERKLRSDFDSRRLTAEELDQKLELARFERDERVAESSLKYAYTWFQTAVELFSPPESRWVVLCREKMTQTRELWKKELDAKKIPYQDYMLE
jgi:hypothetical protein